MKILTICQGGGSRSPAACQVLKEMGHDAKFAALHPDSPHDREHVSKELLDWADLVLLFHGESPQNEVANTDINKTHYMHQYGDYAFKTKFIWCYDAWGAPVGDGQLEYFRYFFAEIMPFLNDWGSCRPCKHFHRGRHALDNPPYCKVDCNIFNPCGRREPA